MDTASLTALSPLDGRYQKKVQPLQKIFSEYGLIKFRLIVEIKWLLFLTEAKLPEVPTLSVQAKKILNDLIDHFSEKTALRVKEIEDTTNHDVKAIEYFIQEKIQDHAELKKLNELIHFGCTSEDINNLAYGLMLKTAREECLVPHLQQLLNHLKSFALANADVAMLARTHGQAATPTTVGKEIANVISRLQRQLTQFTSISILGKLNGASGNYNALCVAYPEVNWHELSEQFVKHLGLSFNPYTTQIEPHDAMSEYFSTLIRINTILIDFDRDTWGYISLGYFKQKTVAHEVGSSTMPHKINPIDFENGEGNLGIANALLEHMSLKLPISRWQRDLSDSTVLRNIGVALGHSLLGYLSTQKGVEKLETDQTQIAKDLDAHWEILGEAIQTVMRRYGLKTPYEQLKDFTRGKQINQATLHAFINNLDLPKEAKERLLTLTPATYLGYAKDLAHRI